ncbi:MAG: hypothetical protein M9890_00360 [Thermomicrobiales bacterium]|nr:hypothetical protein [Thermomicrobiales bacterium]
MNAENAVTRRGKPLDRRRWDQFEDIMTRRIADIDYLASEQFGTKHGVVLVAAGMRGAITLAAAQLLPVDTPHRSLLILVAFFVAAGTLILQGGTLPTLVRALKLPTQNSAANESLMQQLGIDLNQAVLNTLDAGELTKRDGTPFSESSITQARSILHTMLNPPPELEQQASQGEISELRLEVIEAGRAELLRIRDRGTYPSDVLSAKLAQLDADQISIEARLH